MNGARRATLSPLATHSPCSWMRTSMSPSTPASVSGAGFHSHSFASMREKRDLACLLKRLRLRWWRMAPGRGRGQCEGIRRRGFLDGVDGGEVEGNHGGRGRETRAADERQTTVGRRCSTGVVRGVGEGCCSGVARGVARK